MTVFTGKIELGQGIGTALRADRRRRAGRRSEARDDDYPATRRAPQRRRRPRAASRSSRAAPRCASPAAEAREILLSAAAAKLGVAARALSVDDGTVTAPGGKSHAYWDRDDRRGFSSARRRRRRSPRQRPGSQVASARASFARDIPARRCTGGAAYVQDVRLPGMVFGRVGAPAFARARSSYPSTKAAVKRDARCDRDRARRQFPRRRGAARGAGDHARRTSARESRAWKESESTAAVGPTRLFDT